METFNFTVYIIRKTGILLNLKFYVQYVIF